MQHFRGIRSGRERVQNTQLTIRLPKELRTDVDNACYRARVNVSDVVREALETFVQLEQKTWDTEGEKRYITKWF